jgi:hypothetical protein
MECRIGSCGVVVVGWRSDIEERYFGFESPVNLHPPRACALTESSYCTVLYFSARKGHSLVLLQPSKRHQHA